MLSRLSIRDIVLIDRLDIDFGRGLAVLTGETGAGKSILLDAFALALGARGEASLVREGAEQGQVTAAFDIGKDHPVREMLAEHGLAGDGSDTGELIVRRIQFADGRTRAFVNDEPVSAARPEPKSISSRSIRTMSRIERRVSMTDEESNDAGYYRFPALASVIRFARSPGLFCQKRG